MICTCIDSRANAVKLCRVMRLKYACSWWKKQAQLEEATELVSKLEAELMEERETRMLVEKGFIRATALRFFNPNVEGTWPCDAIANVADCCQPT